MTNGLFRVAWRKLGRSLVRLLLLYVCFCGTMLRGGSRHALTETEVSHRAGLFSQLFKCLETFYTDLLTHGNSSSAKWYINGYAPTHGAGWQRGHFEDIFLPVRIRNDVIYLPNASMPYFETMRLMAKQIFRPSSEVQTLINKFKQLGKFDARQTVCLHVRRGDKREGIRRLTDEQISNAISYVNRDFNRLYLLTDESFHLMPPALWSNVSVSTFPENLCKLESPASKLTCFASAVIAATSGICDTFVGSSTSNLSRFIMLLGPKFLDLDGVVDYYTASTYGRWYKLPDHCHVVDGTLNDGELCGYLSNRCPHCRKHTCKLLPACDMPAR